MSLQPFEITLGLRPESRFEIVDITGKIRELYGDLLQRYRKIACCSFHTTAGYLEQGFCARLDYSENRLNQFIRIFQDLFPPNAGYFHDRMELREELSESEKAHEPPNADSHLTFISAGLKNCVTYKNRPSSPIYFIDLDGVNKNRHRDRRTRIVAYNREETVYRGDFEIPAPMDHPINSFSLRDPRYGLFSHLNDLLDSHSMQRGFIRIALAQEEQHAGLTVNEYETLLMRSDLPQAMRDPLRYMVRRGMLLLQNPASIPEKTKGYAVYDLIHLYNKLMNNMQIGRSVLDTFFSYLSAPVSRIFRLKRHINLLVSNSEEAGVGRIVQGTYQTPILLQYQRAERGVRRLRITLRKFR